MKYDEVVPMQEIALERVRYAVSQRVSRAQLQDMRLDALPDFVSQGLVYQLSVGVAGRKATAVIEVPADWWEAFKARWFPMWLARRYPVRMQTWRAWEMLPRVPLPERYLEGAHFVFRREL